MSTQNKFAPLSPESQLDDFQLNFSNFPNLNLVDKTLAKDLFTKLQDRNVMASNKSCILKYYPQHASWQLNQFNSYLNKYLLPPAFVKVNSPKPIAIHLLLDHSEPVLDLLALLYVDDIILKLKGSELIETWYSMSNRRELEAEIKKRTEDTIFSQRLGLQKVAGYKLLNSITNYKDLLTTLFGYHTGFYFKARVIDIEARYGEFMFACLSLSSVERYTGVSSNQAIVEALNQAITDLNTSKTNFKVYNNLFENQKYNLAFYSPELGDDDKPQTNHNDILMAKFIIPQLDKLWSCLEADGFLIFRISDSRKTNITACLNLYIEQKLPYASYLGVIGQDVGTAKAIPIWIWQRKTIDQKVYRWQPNSNIKLVDYQSASIERNFDEVAHNIYNVRNSNS